MTVLDVMTWTVFGFAAGSAILFAINILLFQPPRSSEKIGESAPSVSVLIPARNEAAGISDAMDCVLASRHAEFELLILDDNSTDDTARIVKARAATDHRVQYVAGEPLPDGWCGKQFACHQLANAAKTDLLLFIDADVRLQPTAIASAIAGMQRRRADLYSGFPRLEVGSLGEGLLIPMIYLVLLTYLPMFFMRWTGMKSAAAGCGQFFLTTRQAYEQSSGHASIRSSLHDGVTLPRSYRDRGLRTDLFDASPIATCRMYDGWTQSWLGLSKNAHEGIATPRRIIPFSLLLFLGYVAPIGILLLNIAFDSQLVLLSAMAVALCYLPRLTVAWRYDRNWLAAALLPISVTSFVILQWRALLAHRRGATTEWRGRKYG